MKAFAAIFAHILIMGLMVFGIWHWSHGGKFGAWPMAGIALAYVVAFIRYGCLSH